MTAREPTSSAGAAGSAEDPSTPGSRSSRARKPPVEVELKYRMKDVAAGERYLAARDIGGLRASTPTRTTQLEDRYIDTPDGALARAGFAARLRVSRNGTLVTVKSMSRRPGAGNAHRRDELEGPADRTAGPRDWPPSDARSLILELCGDAPLVELVTVRQLRRRRELRAGETAVELSLDEVDVVERSEVIQRFAELEFELIRGADTELAKISAELDKDGSLSPAPGSKLEAALAAVKAQMQRHASGGRGTSRPAGERTDQGGDGHGHGADAAPAAPAPASSLASVPAGPSVDVREAESPPASVEPRQPPVGKTPGVSADDSLAEAGRKVLRFHFARMIAREPGTRDGHDPEDLHGMRVATRRMRAAWRVFGDSFRQGRTRRYRRELRSVAARLGAVRDLDVLIEAAEDYRASQSTAEQRAMLPLLTAWHGYRDDARALLLRELDAPGYVSFVEDFRVFVVTEGAGARDVSAMDPHRVRDTAPSRIWSAYEGVRAYEAVLRWADVETLHNLRIAAKWLRYTMEFVREALGPDATDLINRVVALQDHLGLLHDADVGASMARSFLVERAGSISSLESEAVGRYLVSRERELARLKRTVGRPWRGVASLAYRRRLGRAVAGL